MINATVTIWIQEFNFSNFLSTMNVLNSDGTGLLGITEDGKKYLKEKKFVFYTFEPAAKSEWMQVNISAVHFAALRIIEKESW